MEKYSLFALAAAVVIFENWLWIEKSVLQSFVNTALFFIIYFIVIRMRANGLKD